MPHLLRIAVRSIPVNPERRIPVAGQKGVSPVAEETPASDSTRRTAMPGSSAALSIVLAYACFASLWILLSDKAVALLFSDPEKITLVSTLKGWLFVAVTSLLLYVLIRRLLKSAGAQFTPVGSLRSLLIPGILIGIVIAALTAGAVYQATAHQRAKEGARLQAIADLKTAQIQNWLQERLGDARFIQDSRFFSEAYGRWHATGNAADFKELQTRIASFGKEMGFASLLLLDDQGRTVWNTEGAHGDVDPLLKAAVRKAVERGNVSHFGPYRHQTGQLHLDFIAPLQPIKGKPGPVVILHTNPSDYLFSTLQTWPVPSVSGETLLFRRDGEHVVYLNDLRHASDAAAALRRPLSQPDLLAGKVLRGEASAGQPLQGVDYRSMPVLGVAKAVKGTDWFLIAKMDREEIFAESTRDAVWIALAGILALFMVAAGGVLIRQRQHLMKSLKEREAQAERLRNLQLLDAIANSSTDAIFAKDQEGKYILFNRAAAAITGTTVEAVLGNDDSFIFPPEQTALIMANDRQVMESGHAITFQERLETTAGHVNFLATKGPLRNEDGVVIGMFGISRDITEREQAAWEREITVGFLQLVNQSSSELEMIRAAITFFQEHSGCEAVGIRLKEGDDYPYYESRGFPPAFILAENSLCRRDALGKIERDDVGNPVLDCMCGNIISGRFDPAKPFFSPKGSFWTNSTSELLASTSEEDRLARTRNRCNGEGYESVALIALTVGENHLGLLQINDRRTGMFTPEKISLWERLAGYLAVALAKCKAEAALRESDVRLHLALRSAQMGVWEWNLQTNNVIWSPECYELFGLTRFGGTEPDFMRMLHPDDVERVRTAAHKAILERSTYTAEFRVVLRDGTVLWVSNVGRADYDHTGEAQRMVGIVQDISAQKRAEEERSQLQEQIMQAQKMESVGRLAGGVAHDFNNMLAVIFISLELIKMKISPDNPLHEQLGEILHAATRARDITRQLLAFSRKQVIAPQVLDLNRMIANAEKTLARLIGEDISLRFLPDQSLGKIKIDPSQIDQVLMNLAVNARDAMPDGGKLTIETANVEFDDAYCRLHAGFQPGRYVQLSVSDEGVGISAEIREHIFEPFFTTKEVGRGTGLGLAMIYGIVQQNQGFISVYSEVGLGTIFKLFFPRFDGDAAAVEPIQEKAIEGNGSLLLVEDDEMLCRVTKATLEKLGYSVTAVVSPEEALRIAGDSNAHFDLLLTDVIMPGMNGMQMRDRIIALLPDIKVLFMSGYTSDAIVKRGVLDDGVNFIQKPFSVNALAAKLENILNPKE